MKHTLLLLFQQVFRRALPGVLLVLLPLLGLAQSTTLVISQVYTAGGNSGATYANDYVELFNKSTGPISLSGYSLAYNGDTPFALTATASLPAGGYYLVQLAAGTTGAGMALPAPNQTSSIGLATAGGRLELLLAPGATSVDKVAYGTGSDYEGSGAAPAPSTTQAIFRPLGGCTDTDDNKNDFSLAAAAPRNAALVPSPCAGPAPTISSFSPASGPAGTRVTVQGSGFAGNASVAFGGVAASVVAVASPTMLVATVPSGAASGPITVTTANGSVTSANNFTVIVPVITAAPASLAGLAASQGSASAPQTYQLSGSALDGTSLTITTSATSLEVSFDGTNYARSASLPLNGATTLGATTVYVRLASGTALGNVSGSIANTNGPTTATVAVRGAVLAPVAAKRWTGAAGTDSWFDAGNWAGSTLPGAGDDVVLDHSTVAGKYTVKLGNSASTAPTAVSVASLRLRPAGGDSILFVIPSTNTVSDAAGGGPALLLTRSAAGDTALLVSNRAFFTNASGAASGAVLDAMGSTNPTVFLLNGGSFRHQTARGVTGIVENLASAPGTEAGNFYYRPLGTSSFTTPLAGRTYGNLILQFLRNGNFTSINYGASGGSPLTVNGGLTIESGATLSYNALANLVLRGNLVNNGIFRYAPNYGNPAPSPLPTYRLVLQGTAPQVLRGNALIDPTASSAAQSSYLAATIQLEINNPAGATLQTPVTLSNALALTSGLLTTDATNILTMTLAGTAAVQGGSDASFVNGPVRRPVGPVASTAASVAYVFPIGKGTAYRPLTLTVASQTGTTNYRAEQFEGNPIRNLAATDPNGSLTRVSRVRYFTLTPFNLDATPVITQPAGFTGAVALTYGSDDGVTDAADPTLVVAKRSDVTQPWYNFGHGKAAGPANGNLVMSGTITSFSDFALGSTDPATAANPLPVQLVHFVATRLAGGAVALTWTTASELNSARFEVARSLDGVTFTPVATLGAQGTSTQARTYVARDAAAPASALYYRLRLVDLDGTSAYSPTATVAAGLASELVLSPNPTRDQLYFFTEAAGTYTVRSLLGQEMLRGPVAPGLNQLPVGQLPAGVYLLELPTSAGRVVRRFAKE
ncbi:T9SS type A sorting domain-containing protein [Hymenobacter sp. RP-2-7]|uniref:T9SS type A sorting domain-containing protein n=1 Tax=Hymenobacter polaris TaxID=2682546 RepID=A0A7Y0AAI8_9BACT|nr:lamin tail domain-containing protein [Hymenobacter polaris]NML63769.1 T9SS type A sorting domain-containing protein [Hymenobacter polaris]